MSWMSGLGWKEGLSGIQLQRVEELEKNLNKQINNVSQKQMLIDGLNQSVEKLKRKVNREVSRKCPLNSHLIFHEMSSGLYCFDLLNYFTFLNTFSF